MRGTGTQAKAQFSVKTLLILRMELASESRGTELTCRFSDPRCGEQADAVVWYTAWYIPFILKAVKEEDSITVNPSFPVYGE